MQDKKDSKNFKNQISEISITNSDLDYVVSYIKERQTAILVMMFTDIVGFTRITEERGEKYAATFRTYHDKILTEEIEKNGAGKVVKYIGDSVMAIFSEPTKAVEISIKIQEKLDVFNESMPDMDDIKVRIGLHMGQVAIENNIQADIFGRHVNRASRIESLASSGQIFLSYPVFDSAKGWLQDMEYIGWKSHGEYYLKGIDKPAEIYEVYNKDSVKPKAPQKAKKKRAIPSYLFIVLFTLLGAIGGFAVLSYQKTEVFMFDFKYEDVRTLDGNKLFLDGEPEDNKRLVLTDLKKGKNILYYDVSAMVRYYTEVDIKRGENLLEPSFKRFGLPEFELTADFSEYDTFKDSMKKSFSYYNSTGQKVDKEVELKVNYGNLNKGTVNNYTANWELFIDGISAGKASKKLSIDTASRDYIREPYTVVVKMDEFNFEMRYIMSNETLKINFIGVWN